MIKIELNEKEIELIERQLSGNFNPFMATLEEKEIYSGVIDKADALVAELDEWDESNDNLVQWFYDKYKSQQKA